MSDLKKCNAALPVTLLLLIFAQKENFHSYFINGNKQNLKIHKGEIQKNILVNSYCKLATKLEN